jgi:hypothetical protein
MTTKITLTNIDSTGDYSELVDAAYNTANAASSYANSAFAAANNSTDTWVRSAANSASSYANSAYTQANTGTTNAATADQRAVTSGDYANSAYSTANSAGVYANAAFAKANTGSSSAGITFTANSGVPTTANVGDQWWSTNDDILYEYINDGTSNVWLDISSSAITSTAVASSSSSTNNARSMINSYVFGS